MKILFIGGTGTISMAITRLLAQRDDEEFDKWCDAVIAASEKMKENFRCIRTR